MRGKVKEKRDGKIKALIISVIMSMLATFPVICFFHPSCVCGATALCLCNHGDVLFLYIVHLYELRGCSSSTVVKGRRRKEDLALHVGLTTSVSHVNAVQPSYII